MLPAKGLVPCEVPLPMRLARAHAKRRHFDLGDKKPRAPPRPERSRWGVWSWFRTTSKGLNPNQIVCLLQQSRINPHDPILWSAVSGGMAALCLRSKLQRALVAAPSRVMAARIARTLPHVGYHCDEKNRTTTRATINLEIPGNTFGHRSGHNQATLQLNNSRQSSPPIQRLRKVTACERPTSGCSIPS